MATYGPPILTNPFTELLGGQGAIPPTPLGPGTAPAPALPVDPFAPAPAPVQPVTSDMAPSPSPAGVQTGPFRDFDQLGQQTGQAQQRMQEEERVKRYAGASTEGFWPTALGIYALARGNPGPLLQMQQQKQATRFAQAITPDTIKINELVTQGKFDDAAKLLDVVSASVGARAPQILPYLQQKAKDIADVRYDMQQLTSAANFLTTVIPPEHENYKALQGLQKLVKDASPLGRDLAKELISKNFSSHFQVIDGMLHRTGAVTGVTVSQPVPEGVRPQSIRDNPVMMGVAAAARVQPEELASILKRLPTQTQEGLVLPDSPRANQIREAALAGQPQIAAVMEAKQIPDLTPDLMEEGFTLGLTNADMAAKRFGRTPEEAQQNVAIMQRQRQMRHTDQVAHDANAQILVKMNTDPTTLKDQVVYEADPANADRFGQAVPLQTVRNVMASGGKLNVTDPTTHQKVILPATKAIRTLNRIPDMFKELGNPDTWDKAIPTGLATRLQDYLGIAIQPNQTKYQVIRAYIKRAVEDALGTQGVDEVATGTLKSFMTGPITKASDAIDAAALLQQFVADTLYNVTGRRVVLPTGPGTAQPGAPPSAAPAAPAAPPRGGAVSLDMGRKYLPGAQNLSDEQLADLLEMPKNYQRVRSQMTPAERRAADVGLAGAQPLTEPLPQAPLAPPSTPTPLPQGGTAAPPVPAPAQPRKRLTIPGTQR